MVDDPGTSDKCCETRRPPIFRPEPLSSPVAAARSPAAAISYPVVAFMYWTGPSNLWLMLLDADADASPGASGAATCDEGAELRCWGLSADYPHARVRATTPYAKPDTDAAPPRLCYPGSHKAAREPPPEGLGR